MVLKTKTELEPNPCQDLFVQLGPQTRLGPSLIAHSAVARKAAAMPYFVQFPNTGISRSRIQRRFKDLSSDSALLQAHRSF